MEINFIIQILFQFITREPGQQISSWIFARFNDVICAVGVVWAISSVHWAPEQPGWEIKRVPDLTEKSWLDINHFWEIKSSYSDKNMTPSLILNKGHGHLADQQREKYFLFFWADK